MKSKTYLTKAIQKVLTLSTVALILLNANGLWASDIQRNPDKIRENESKNYSDKFFKSVPGRKDQIRERSSNILTQIQEQMNIGIENLQNTQDLQSLRDSNAAKKIESEMSKLLKKINTKSVNLRDQNNIDDLLDSLTSADEQREGSGRELKAGPKKQQNQAQSDEKTYTIHMIPHSHQDVGWLLTYDEYYKNHVRFILDRVYESLWTNSNWTFNHAEVKFFQMWWTTQNETTKANFKQLVKEGRFEFISGGISSSDEACPVFEDILSNIQTGHDFLKQEFGVVPKVAWHADAFGHSSTNARLFQELGFEAFFFGRVSDDQKDEMKEKHDMQFVWRPTYEGPDGSVQSTEGLLTTALFKTYQFPCDITVQEFWNIHGIPGKLESQLSGIDQNPQRYVNCLNEIADSYKTQNLIITTGDDFAFYYAKETFEFIEKFAEKLHKHSNGKFTLKFSTVQKYLNALTDELVQNQEIVLNEYTEDFFPLHMQYELHFWNGYYTSRPNFKEILRDLSYNTHSSLNFYSMYLLKSGTADQLDANRKLFQNISNDIQNKLGMFQHHDTITGTSRNYVTTSEIVTSESLIEENGKVQANLLKALLKNEGFDAQKLKLLHHKTNDKLQQTQYMRPGDEGLVVVNNPSVFEYDNVQITLSTKCIKVEGWDDQNKRLEPVKFNSFCHTDNRQKEEKECDIYLHQTIKPLDQHIFIVTGIDCEDEGAQVLPSPNDNQIPPPRQNGEDGKAKKDRKKEGGVGDTGGFLRVPEDRESTFMNELSNKYNGLAIGSEQCHLFISDKTTNSIEFRYRELLNSEKNIFQDRQFKFDFRYYESYTRGSMQKSGVYTFKTVDSDSRPYNHKIVGIEVFKGDEIEQFFIRYQDLKNPSQTQTLKIKLIPIASGNEGCPPIEFEVDFSSLEMNQDVTINWKDMNVQNKGLFYTDSNGLGMLKRQFKSDVKDKDSLKAIAPQNYYPINSAIFIENTNMETQMVVMNDRCQAGSGFRDGRIELMFNRRGSSVDDLGLPESMNENDEKGQPIKTNHKYWLKFTLDREHAFKTIFEQTIGKTQNPLQIFVSSEFTHSKAFRPDNVLKDAEREVKREEFVKYLTEKSVVDIKLIPDSQMKSILVRLLQYPNVNNQTDIDMLTLQKKLCEFANSENRAQLCKSLNKDKIKRVKLTGHDYYDDENPLTLNKEQSFKFDTFRIDL